MMYIQQRELFDRNYGIKIGREMHSHVSYLCVTAKAGNSRAKCRPFVGRYIWNKRCEMTIFSFTLIGNNQICFFDVSARRMLVSWVFRFFCECHWYVNKVKKGRLIFTKIEHLITMTKQRIGKGQYFFYKSQIVPSENVL